jgi:FkbM family methyltransferase
MSRTRWKKFEQSDGYRKVKLKLKQLIGREPKLKIDKYIKTEEWEGWELVTELVTSSDIIYSFGICDDIGFELAACNKGAKVFALDPTPYSVDWVGKQSLPEHFKFFPWAAAGTDGHYYLYPRISKKGKKSSVMYTFHQESNEQADGVEVRALSLKTIASELGHESIDILKMDIEGAEYEVIDDLLSSGFNPKMLLIEFHHRFEGIGKEKTIDSLSKLRNAGYLLVKVSVTGREVCLVHDSQVELISKAKIID